jgi:hypothetical protein
MFCSKMQCRQPRETCKRRAALAPPIINSFLLDNVSCIQENEESEDESLEWSRGGNNDSSAFTWQCHDAMVTMPQHDSDDESSDDDSADSHEDSTEGKEEMKRRRDLLHHHLLKTKSALKARCNFADHEMVLLCVIDTLCGIQERGVSSLLIRN